MAKGAYVGINNSAHKVKDIYVGVNGIARKVTKGYIGVNGVAQQFWPAGKTPGLSWDDWTTIPKVLMQAGWEHTVTKVNYKIAYYGFVRISERHFSPILMSPDSDACTFTVYSRISGQKTYGTLGSITDDNGIVWYFSGMAGGLAIPGTPSSEVLITNKIYSANLAGYTEAATDFLNRIYSVPYHEDYQIGQTYRIPACGDTRRTLRKVIGWQLFGGVQWYDASNHLYKTYSDNIDTIIDTIIQNINDHNNYNGMIIVDCSNSFDDSDYTWDMPLYVLHGHYASGEYSSPGDPKINYMDQCTIIEKEPDPRHEYSGDWKPFSYYYCNWAGWDWETGESYIECVDGNTYFSNYAFMEWYIICYVNSDGTIEWSDDDTYYGGEFVKNSVIGIQRYYGAPLTTNLGVDY